MRRSPSAATPARYSRVGHVDTALEASVEVALSTATSEDLSLNNDILSVLLELVGEVEGLVGSAGRLAKRSRDSVL